jgi:hypothetical protein
MEDIVEGASLHVEPEGCRLEQRERPDPIGVPEREFDRGLAPVAPPDHHRRDRVEHLEERRPVLGVLRHVRLVRLGPLAPAAPPTVVDDQATEVRERPNRRGLPHPAP